MILKPYLQLGKRTETTPYYFVFFSSEKLMINLLHKFSMKLLGTLMVDLLSRTVKFNIDTLSVSLSGNGC